MQALLGIDLGTTGVKAALIRNRRWACNLQCLCRLSPDASTSRLGGAGS